MPERSLTGCFGKIPSHGDFIRRNLTTEFVEAWDSWLQKVIADSRDRLGKDWAELYLESPIWCFALDAGIAAPSPIAGVMLPSVDSVGRCFPFTVAQPQSHNTRALCLKEAAEWYEHTAALALSVLEPDFSLETFMAELERQDVPAVTTSSVGTEYWFKNGSCSTDVLLDWLQPCCAFWSEGSPHVEGGLLVSKHLPSASRFSFMLSGRD